MWRVRADARAKHEQILESARILFSTKGFEAVTMDEVAKSARVGPGTLYRHFPTKDELYGAVHIGRTDEVDVAIGRALEYEGNPREQLATWLSAYVTMLTINTGHAALITRALGRPDSPFAPKCTMYIEATRRVISALGPALRTDIDALQVCRLVGGLAITIDEAGLPASAVDALLAIVLEGLAAVG